MAHFPGPALSSGPVQTGLGSDAGRMQASCVCSLCFTSRAASGQTWGSRWGWPLCSGRCRGRGHPVGKDPSASWCRGVWGPWEDPIDWAGPSFVAPVGGCPLAPPGEVLRGALPGADRPLLSSGSWPRQPEAAKVGKPRRAEVGPGALGSPQPLPFSQQPRFQTPCFLRPGVEGLTTTLRSSPRVEGTRSHPVGQRRFVSR